MKEERNNEKSQKRKILMFIINVKCVVLTNIIRDSFWVKRVLIAREGLNHQMEHLNVAGVESERTLRSSAHMFFQEAVKRINIA